MWLGLFERVHVYLGTGLVLVQRSGVSVSKLQPPSTLPLTDVLRWVDEQLDRAHAKPWLLSVHVSAALCAPSVFVSPTGIQRSELSALAQASAARAWGLGPNQEDAVVCCHGAEQRGLTASFLKGVHVAITEWASGHRGRLLELVPLWALATQCQHVRSTAVSAMALLEPDALTWIRQDGHRETQAACWYGALSVADAKALLAEKGGGDWPPSLSAMGFAAESTAEPWPAGPKEWRRHWSRLP